MSHSYAARGVGPDYNALESMLQEMTAGSKQDIDNDDRMEKSRERNREHAKKTRLRKKAQIEGMKERLLELQNEVRLAFVCHSV